MTYLAIDTSGKYLTVIANGKKKSIRFLADCALSHSVVLMGEIENALKESDIEISDVDIFACSVGAGSFTGIRIGVSTIKAFAYAFHKKTLGITSFETLAFSVTSSVRKLTIISARHGNYYACGFDEDNKIIIPPCFMSAENIKLKKNEYTIIADEDLDDIGALIADVKTGFERVVEAKLGQAEYDVEMLVPLYVKKSQAEEET